MMNKFSTVALSGLLAASMSSAAFAEPTRTLFTETANTAANGSVSVDFEYPFTIGGIGTGVRVGALGGEILLNNSNTGFSASSIGYKKVVEKNLAAYGILSYYNEDVSGTSFTDFALGVAYTLKQNNMVFNVNGEMITDDSGALRGGDTTIFVKGSAQIYTENLLPHSSLFAEIALEDNDFIETQTALGMRWEPSKRVTTDLIIYLDDGSGIEATAIPGYVKINVAF